MVDTLEYLANSVSRANNLEELTRPMLELLEKMTHLESTYLTTIDEAAGVQRILYSRNMGDLNIPEGLLVPWSDTLCKRALDEKSFLTRDVPGVWGDSEAAAALGLQTYLSSAVYTDDGELYGTLCGASAKEVDVSPDVSKILELFTRLISQQASREKVAREATERALAAELRAREMQFVAEIGAMCLSASDLPTLLRGLTRSFTARNFWQEAVPFVAERGSTRLLQDDQAPYHELIATMLGDARASVGFQPLFVKANYADPLIHEALALTGQSEKSLLFLMSAASGVELLGGVLLIGGENSISDSEQAMVQSCWQILTLFAERHHEHELLEAANATLTLHARHDPLTQLPNRRYLVDEMKRLLGHAARTGETVYVAFVDLDNFKVINDTHGHDVGDDFLQEIAQRLQSTARSGDLTARYGGDEFILVAVNHGEQIDNAEGVIAARITDAMSGTFVLPGLDLQYDGPSVGVISWQGNEVPDADELLASADKAMYAIKQKRRKKHA
ncbi:GGDEF domain-containing protein [Pseudohongiella acticola]|jgi:diguanylate cyclase (GGDEF)-like protein|uniref:GGDEF domain-containing protein n=1 Tax=Pseudohongiella acticola TaxID=1524254 RepID=UPI0030ECEC6D